MSFASVRAQRLTNGGKAASKVEPRKPPRTGVRLGFPIDQSAINLPKSMARSEAAYWWRDVLCQYSIFLTGNDFPFIVAPFRHTYALGRLFGGGKFAIGIRMKVIFLAPYC